MTQPLDDLFARVYAELQRIARARYSGLTPTLDTAAVVHEAYARLRHHGGPWDSEGHVRAVACLAMRQVVANYLRQKKQDKRGGSHTSVTLSEDVHMPVPALDPAAILDLDRALETLASVSERQAAVVNLRFFGGYEVKEVADTLDIGEATVTRDWRKARAFLLRYIDEDPGSQPGTDRPSA